MTAFLEVQNATKIFARGLLSHEQTVALQDFSFVLNTEPASIVSVVGESGSGKTTLARLLLGVITPTKGSVLYNGKDLTELTREERRTFRRRSGVSVRPWFVPSWRICSLYNPSHTPNHRSHERQIHQHGKADSDSDGG